MRAGSALGCYSLLLLASFWINGDGLFAVLFQEQPRTWLENAETWVGIAESLATIVAFIVGGWWTYKLFVKKREAYPRLQLEHVITHRAVDARKIWLHVALKISNSGEVLFGLLSASTRVDGVLPPSPDLLAKLQAGQDPVGANETEVRWPRAHEPRKTEWPPGEYEIEPGESHTIDYDFFLDSAVQTVEVYSYVKNTSKAGREIGWGLTTIYDLTAAEEAQPAAKVKSVEGPRAG